MAGAEEILDIMKKRGRKRDVIICTTLIKGYCLAGRTQQALAFFNDMVTRTPIVTPNIRTINTLLRGCVQTGSVCTAEALVLRAQKDFKLQLDVSSWEYLIALLAQSLKLDKMLPIIGRIKDDAAFANGMAGMYVNTARAAAVLGDWKVCKKSIASANASIEKAVLSTGDDDEDQEVGDVGSSGSALKSEKNTGGKRAWSTGEVDERRTESLELYREHLKAELSTELKVIETFMDKMKSSNVTPFQYMFPYFLRVFPLAAVADGSPKPTSEERSDGKETKKKDNGSLKKELVKPIMRSVEDNFGLDVFARRLTQKSCDDLNGYSLDPVKVAAASAPPVLSARALKVKKNKEKARRKKEKEELAASGVLVDSSSVGAVPATPASTSAPVTPAAACAAAGAGAGVAAAAAVVERPPLTPLEAQIASFRALSARAFDSSGKFAFRNVFSYSPSESPSTTTTTQAPHLVLVRRVSGSSEERELKVEVCSGAGEWVVAQAKSDSASDWVAMELRHDRAYQTLTKAVFANVPNLAVLCGDAMHILPTHFPTAAVSKLFVNHPEPPQQTGGRGDSQNRHLLEEGFFVEATRILKPNGMLTIVTDNLWYGRLLMRLVAAMPLNAFGEDAATAFCLQSVAPPAASQKSEEALESTWEAQETEGGVALYVGKPGAAAGHVVEASSYFDRLWKRGNLVERYFLVLQKVPVGQAMSHATAPAVTKKRPIGSVE
eukprot:CAMPEP_0170356704 /NCGR_PEP_ID=MMETSP0117_2-20130122/1315_1 /TAXON_ID=400756 /ORGANISM="Durinskia baltica, Strain CSIRO CS-38" /LENGTH=720 /DNA_ID=CAMNT_0010610821 /DNA_START=174 /DNA_END=2332 /DNA_ORIENTATION=-